MTTESQDRRYRDGYAAGRRDGTVHSADEDELRMRSLTGDTWADDGYMVGFADGRRSIRLLVFSGLGRVLKDVFGSRRSPTGFGAWPAAPKETSMDSQQLAPDAAAMRQACDEALQHLLPRTTDPELTAIIDPVPHFMPGMGTSGEWYRVGALHLVATDRYLTVYLDAMTGKVQMEQALMDVDSRPLAIPSVHKRRPGTALARDRWENEGGAI